MKSLLQLQETHAQWIEEAIRAGSGERDPTWTESVAVGRSEFVRDVQVALGSKARYREVVAEGQAHVLREPPTLYGVGLGPGRTGASA